MPDPAVVVEKQQELKAKQEVIGEVYKLAGKDLDFSTKGVLEKLGAANEKDALEKLSALNGEAESLGLALKRANLELMREQYQERQEEMEQPAPGLMRHQPMDLKARSFGEIIIASPEFQTKAAAKWKGSQGIDVNVDISLKTLFETGAGFAPQSVRSGLMVEGVTRPLQLTDLIPTRPINQNTDKYMAETTRTHNATEKGEGVAYTESVFVWTEQTSPVQKITDSLPVTDEQLEDAPEIASVLNSRLIFGLRQRLETQVLVGDGSSPNLRGFLDSGFGIQTQAKGGDATFDAVFKAMTLVRFTGRAIPSGIIMHPNDWQDVRLTKTASGEYIMGPPMAPGATTLFGVPVVICDGITENTGLVGDFANFCYIGERRGVDVQVGYSGTQFAEGKKLIRADLRACFTVPRVTAFCSVTGI